MDLHSVATTGSGVLSAIGTALSTLKNARDLAKESKDHELKDVISDAYDQLIDLKERMLALDEENRNLKTKLAERDSIVGPILPFGYFYLATDTSKASPLCPHCWQDKDQKYPLQAESWNGGQRRRCCRCGFIKQESTGPAGPTTMSRRPYTNR